MKTRLINAGAVKEFREKLADRAFAVNLKDVPVAAHIISSEHDVERQRRYDAAIRERVERMFPRERGKSKANTKK